ncbi:MAG: SGNH/GDSL hydrolase family protein [Candidatus Palauibacterales bacterium]|nr:SGNH/GDSL hydrolase family protein [Candidatus Palauibacterales bacterium]MDP2584264.1 SGNH/GDSL hydrolase family protein [Candidatus Palauibacterales bacterium]
MTDSRADTVTRLLAQVREGDREAFDRRQDAAEKLHPLPALRTYISLGDSISIDLYPGLDAAERERLPQMPPGLGAASLLHRNDDGRWPEFTCRDLVSVWPEVRYVALAEDGATTASVLRLQLPRLPEEVEGPVLVTLTAGGNDLVGLLDMGSAGPALGAPDPAAGLVEEAARTLERVVRELRTRFPSAALLVGTVYDPSDGTGDLGDGVRRTRELEALATFNGRVEAIARGAGATVVPIHHRFLGHGLTEPDVSNRWYWRHLVIEPSARGASEVRRLWLEALGM